MKTAEIDTVMEDKKTKQEEFGIIGISKPSGITSHDVVNKIRKLYKTKQVGHTGTLDPIAEGVMIVLVGRAVKASEYVTGTDKRYRASIKLGITTDTADITGNVTGGARIEDPCCSLPSYEKVSEAAHSFAGEIMQIPPMYSALKRDGKKLVDLARAGIYIEREARKIYIHSLSIEPINENSGEYSLDVLCSSGTYIRTLCEDIGFLLGCGAVMSSLLRVSCGAIDLSQCKTIDEISVLEFEERYALLSPVESLFYSKAKLILDQNYYRLIRNGIPISQKRLACNHEIGTMIRLYDNNGNFFALGEVTEDAGETFIKAIKIFIL